MVTTLRQRAEQAAREFSGIAKKRKKIADAIERVARETVERVFRSAFYAQRDPKAPGVWIMCRWRDENGNEMIHNDGLWPRLAQANAQIEVIVAAAIAEAEKS